MELNQEQRDSRIQQLYARWLDAWTRIGFAVSLAAFLVYAGGLLQPWVPLESLPALWGLPVDEYLRRTGAPTGWGWLALANRADYLNLACVALLGVVTALCYARIVPALLALGERLQATLAVVQVAVLLAAASGLFAGGG